jgi:hypothetical protein
MTPSSPSPHLVAKRLFEQIVQILTLEHLAKHVIRVEVLPRPLVSFTAESVIVAFFLSIAEALVSLTYFFERVWCTRSPIFIRVDFQRKSSIRFFYFIICSRFLNA